VPRADEFPAMVFVGVDNQASPRISAVRELTPMFQRPPDRVWAECFRMDCENASVIDWQGADFAKCGNDDVAKVCGLCEMRRRQLISDSSRTCEQWNRGRRPTSLPRSRLVQSRWPRTGHTCSPWDLRIASIKPREGRLRVPLQATHCGPRGDIGRPPPCPAGARDHRIHDQCALPIPECVYRQLRL
jgi:hypothetical protein